MVEILSANINTNLVIAKTGEGPGSTQGFKITPDKSAKADITNDVSSDPMVKSLKKHAVETSL